MTIICRRAVLVFISLVPMTAFAQEPDSPVIAKDSEDQMIAEAIWSMVDFETNEPLDAQAAFENAAKAYPESAKAAYWRGRFGAYAADRTRITRQISDTLKKLSEPQPEDANLSDPALAQKMRSFRSYAKVIGELLQQRANDESNTEHTESYEASLLDAVTRDPSLIAAWVKLAESPDEEIAFAAIDAWAEQEPDNAIPFYAKAILLSQKTNQREGEPMDVAVIEALEEGNSRPGCRVPEEAAEFVGKPVSGHMFRRLIENMLFQLAKIAMRPKSWQPVESKSRCLTTTDKLDRKQIDAISPEADLVVAPLASLLEVTAQ